MGLTFQQLYRGPDVAICDVSCRPICRQHGREECVTEHLVVFPRSGVFVKSVRGHELVADPNQVLFFNPLEPYRAAHPTGLGDECTVFEFRRGLLQEVLGHYQPRVLERHNRLFEFTHTLSDPAAFLFQQRLRQRLLVRLEDKLMIEELAVGLLAATARRTYAIRGIQPPPHRLATKLAHRDQAQMTCLFLVQHFADKLSLHDVAKAVNSSVFHLARIFQRETGLAIHQYRNRLRLRSALERLVERETDLTGLALDLGFSSHSHLCDAFREAFGVSLSECRRLASSKWLLEMSKNLEAGGRRSA